MMEDDEPDRLPEDPYAFKRVHAWVFVKKGKRGITQNIFIDGT